MHAIGQVSPTQRLCENRVVQALPTSVCVLQHSHGSRTCSWLHAFAREYAGLYASVRYTQGSQTRTVLHAFAREYAGLYASVLHTQGSQARPGLNTFAADA